MKPPPDISQHLGAVKREVKNVLKDGRTADVLVATRTYDAAPEEVWDALTRRERLPRWFMPVSGELRLGGRYQFQGNAGGEITACEPPRRVAATWEFGGQVSWIEVRLTAEAEARAAEAQTTAFYTGVPATPPPPSAG